MRTHADVNVQGKAHLLYLLKNKPAWMVACALLVLLLICYAESFVAQWQYDDFNNIVHNPKVQMNSLSCSSLKQAATAGPDFQIVGRPLAYISFALNYLIGGDLVAGYHLINFCIHWLSAVLLFLFIRDTLALPILEGRYADKATVTAALSAAIWACHPIQVSAVTYIVQRMTSMAGMFYILSLYLFLRARCLPKGGRKWIACAGCAVATICAMLTKENSLLLLYALVLYDLLFFRPINRRSIVAALLKATALSGAIFAVGFLYTNPLELLEPYANRPWSMAERLLSQPRVLFFYLSLLAVPATTRMSILHDISASQGLLVPWNTLPAILALVALGFFLLVLAPRHRLIAFCGLFFLLNHLMESSFLNLELIYEHRNYVPSMFCFLPPAIGIVRTVDHFAYGRRFQSAVWGSVAIFFISTAYCTISYNRIYKTELTLWLHAVRLAPNQSLAHNNLGKLYWEMGRSELAHAEFETALSLNRFNELHQKGSVLFNLGVYEFDIHQNYQRALAYYQESLAINHDNFNGWYQLARTLIYLGDYSAALARLEEARSFWPYDLDMNALASVAYARSGQQLLAMQTALKVLDADRENRSALMVLADAKRATHHHQEAIDLWRRFVDLEPKNIYGYLALIELLMEKQRMEAAYVYFRQLKSLAGGLPLDHMLTLAIEKTAAIPYIPNKEALSAAFKRLESYPEPS